MMDFAHAREQMVRQQLIPRGIRDPAVLEGMRAVAREQFVPDRLVDAAYEDGPLPIGGGQTISQPYIVALMIQALELSDSDRVLEVGTGSGYAAAVTSYAAAEVYTIERDAQLAKAAKEQLERIDRHNVHIQVGDGTLGWPEQAPFHAIVVTAGAPEVPQPLLGQLSVGGRLVVPVGGSGLSGQELLRLRRVSADEVRRESLGAVRFVPLVGAAGWKPAEFGQR